MWDHQKAAHFFVRYVCDMCLGNSGTGNMSMLTLFESGTGMLASVVVPPFRDGFVGGLCSFTSHI